MSLKKITSLTMLLSIVVMTYTGVMLFIAPPGRIANWANWKLLGLSKESYANIHTTFMVLFVLMTLLHIYYNWKPMISYMKNKTKQLVVFTNDMIISLVISAFFIIGTLLGVSPFSSFLDFGDGIKNSWEKEYGTAPYSHAELSSLKMFCKKLGYDLEKSKKILKSNNIVFEESKSLSQIATENEVSPQFIFNLLKKNFEKDGIKTIQLTGLGKKSIKEVSLTLNLTDEQLLLKLKDLGIEAKKDDKFKQVSEKYDMSPMDLIEKLGFDKPQ